MPNFQTGSLIGANFDTTSTTADFTIGTRAQGSGDSMWVYVKANGAIDANDVVTIDATYEATPATVATCMTGAQIGVAQVAFADDAFGWVAIHGYPLNVAVSGTSTLNVSIYVGTVSGHLSTTASSATVAGIAIQTASSTSTGTASTAFVTWPRVKELGL